MNAETFKKFENYLKNQKLRENSFMSYISDIQLFMKFLKESNIEKIDADVISTYIDYKKTQKYSIQSLNRILSSLRKFQKFCKENNLIFYTGPIQKSLKKENKKKVSLSDNEFDKIMSVIPNDNEIGVRDRLMFELMRRYDLKISELLEIKNSDTDINYNKLIIKGTEYKVDNDLNDLIEDHLGGTFEISDFIFSSKKSEKLDRRSAWRILKEYVKLAEIEKNVTLNSIRYLPDT